MSKYNIRQISKFVNKKYRLYVNILKLIKLMFLKGLFELEGIFVRFIN